MHVVDIRVYPVKSTAGLVVEKAFVEPWGLAGDRRWAVVDPDGQRITGREVPRLLTITAVPDAVVSEVAGPEVAGPDAVGLTLHAPGMPPQRVKPVTGGEPVRVGFSRLDHAHGADPAADRWISSLLDRPARLVWLDDPRRRPLPERFGEADRVGDALSLADAAPLLLASVSSLARLNDWIAEAAAERGAEPPPPLSVRRFRPNVVIDAGEPFIEDTWSRIEIGGLPFQVLGPCDRCVFTTIDPDSTERGKEPIRTLARHRKWDGKTWFGVWLVPLATGKINAADPVIPL